MPAPGNDDFTIQLKICVFLLFNPSPFEQDTSQSHSVSMEPGQVSTNKFRIRTISFRGTAQANNPLANGSLPVDSFPTPPDGDTGLNLTNPNPKEKKTDETCFFAGGAE
jgi:hypothetical protein